MARVSKPGASAASAATDSAPQAKLIKGAVQSINNNTLTKVAFAAVDVVYDRNHGGTAHFVDADDALYARVAGLYSVWAMVGFANAAGTYREAQIKKVTAGAVTTSEALTRIPGVAGVPQWVALAVSVELAVGDRVELHALQVTGAAENVSAATLLAFSRLASIA